MILLNEWKYADYNDEDQVWKVSIMMSDENHHSYLEKIEANNLYINEFAKFFRNRFNSWNEPQCFWANEESMTLVGVI